MSGFDIAGVAHSSVTSFITLVQLIKRQIDCHLEVKLLLDNLERLSQQTGSKISLLKGFLHSSIDPCPFVTSTLQKIEDVCDNYSKIHDEIEARYKTHNFFSSLPILI